MGFWDWLTGKPEPEPAPVPEVAAAPTETDIMTSLQSVEAMVTSSGVPAVVKSRALKVTRVVRATLPRLANLGLGSYDAYSVVATATDYLPEAIGAYLRLPRDWADSRPVEKGKTPLLLLVDQLDLLGTTMDKIYDAANSTDASALIAHGRFLQEKFGHTPPATDLSAPLSPPGPPVAQSGTLTAPATTAVPPGPLAAPATTAAPAGFRPAPAPVSPAAAPQPDRPTAPANPLDVE